MIQIEKLKEFCAAHEHLLVYGAGQFSWTVLPFLSTRGYVPEAILVSGKPATSEYTKNIPEYRVADFPRKRGSRYGIVLALQEMYHNEVKTRIRQHFGDDADIFVLRDGDIDRLMNIFITERMFELLEMQDAIDQEEVSAFDTRIESILHDRKKIYLQYIDMRNIGAMVAWIYWCMKRRKNNDDGLYWLLWPVAYPQHEDLELRGANNYLLNKMTMPGMEVVTTKNLRFWRYFYQKDSVSFIIDTNFLLGDWVKQLDTFFWLHGAEARGSYIALDEEEEQQGRKKAATMGIKGDFVCFSTRDELYRSRIMKFSTDVANRSSKYRNYPLELLRVPMESLAQHDLQAIRMGAIVGESIDWANTIDYASRFRSEFMDAWLFKHCRFFACDPSGIQAIPQLFSKPHAMFNLTIQTTRNDYEMTTSAERDIGIFKKYWLPDERRYLTLREMLQAEQDESVHTFASISAYTAYDRRGVVPVNNTEEEVTELVSEMARRLNGTMEYTEEDERLQARYREIVDTTPMKHNFPFIFRMSAHFLRTNPWFLE